MLTTSAGLSSSYSMKLKRYGIIASLIVGPWSVVFKPSYIRTKCPLQQCLSSDVLQREPTLHALFVAYDLDHNGELDRDEFNVLVKDLVFGPQRAHSVLLRFLEVLSEQGLEAVRVWAENVPVLAMDGTVRVSSNAPHDAVPIPGFEKQKVEPADQELEEVPLVVGAAVNNACSMAADTQGADALAQGQECFWVPKNPLLILCLSCSFLLSTCRALVILLLPKYLTTATNDDVIIGMYLALVAVGMLCASPVSAIACPRYVPILTTISASLCFTMVGMLLVGLQPGVGQLYTSAVFLGCGMGLLEAASLSMFMRIIPLRISNVLGGEGQGGRLACLWVAGREEERKGVTPSVGPSPLRFTHCLPPCIFPRGF